MSLSLGFWGLIYINRSSSYQFLFSSSWDRTYINCSSSCQFKFGFLGSYLYQSIIFLSVCVQFELEPHLYRLVIVLLIWVWVFGAAPILIGYLPISLYSVQVGTVPISIGHHLMSLSLGFWDCTYINRSSSYQFEFRFLGLHLYESVIFLSVCIQFELGPHLYQSVIFLSICIKFELRPHLYRSTIFLSSFVTFEFWGRTHIVPLSSYYLVLDFNFWDRTYMNRSSSCQFEFRVLGSQPYWLAIFLLSCVRF